MDCKLIFLRGIFDSQLKLFSNYEQKGFILFSSYDPVNENYHNRAAESDKDTAEIKPCDQISTCYP